jgi:chemotaxis protein MotA
MDVSILVGFSAGLAILALALGLAHVPPSLLMNPEALILVVAGTIIATLAGCGWNSLQQAVKRLFLHQGQEAKLQTADALAHSMDVVTFVREEGLLALQPMIQGIEIPFLKKGLTMLLDNRTERFIRDTMGMEMEVLHRQKLDDARIFETAAGYAPTMGVIGAVIGLVCVMQGLSGQNPGSLGPSIAGAFIATLYGVAFSNLFLLPAASKLRQRARDEWHVRSLLLEAVLGIHAGEHPLLLEERLSAFGSTNATTTQSSAVSTDGDAMDTVRTLKRSHDGAKAKAGYASRPQVKNNVPELRPAHTVMDDDFLVVPSAVNWS